MSTKMKKSYNWADFKHKNKQKGAHCNSYLEAGKFQFNPYFMGNFCNPS